MPMWVPPEKVELELIIVMKDRPVWKQEIGDKFLNPSDHLSDLVTEKLGELLGHSPMTRREVANYRLHDLPELIHYLFYVAGFASSAYFFRIAAPLGGSGLEVVMTHHPGDDPECGFFLDIKMEYGEKKGEYMWKIKPDETIVLPRVIDIVGQKAYDFFEG